jgi:hypothetical protein
MLNVSCYYRIVNFCKFEINTFLLGKIRMFNGSCLCSGIMGFIFFFFFLFTTSLIC